MSKARRFRYSRGTLALVAAAASLVTGVFLSLNYAPTWEAAHASVAHIETNVGLGSLLRGIHHWAGTVAIALALMEGAVQLWLGGYQRPHHRPWLIGVALFAVLVGFGYTGYLLAGDERAFAGVLVLEGVARSMPLIGDAVASVVLGGDTVSSATLTRIYTVHVVVLPAALVLLCAALVRARAALGERAGVRNALAEHAVPGCVLLIAIAAFACLWPVPLGEAGGPSSPASESAQPEWFFLWVNELLYRVEGMTFLVASVLPIGLLVVAFLLPYMRRKPAASQGDLSPGERKPELVGAAAVAAILVVLSVLAAGRELPGGVEEEDEPIAGTDPETHADPEWEEQVTRTLRRFRCANCHVINEDEDGGEDGPPLPLGEEFAELYTRKFFRQKVADPKKFWADTGMTYPKNRKPSPDELAMLERYFYGAK
ncbi:MAG: cytochrome b N-terminal domain-containing protein [Planctomycetota bacterium]